MWLVGVVSRRRIWLVGEIYGCGKNTYIGVVIGCFSKQVLYTIDYYLSLLHLYYLFFGSSIPTSLFF